MLGQHVAYGKIGLRLVARQLGNDRRWWWNADAQHLLHYPIATLYRAGAQSGGVLGHKYRHGQDATASILAGVVHADPVVQVALNSWDAVVLGQHRIDEGVVAVDKVEDG